MILGSYEFTIAWDSSSITDCGACGKTLMSTLYHKVKRGGFSSSNICAISSPSLSMSLNELRKTNKQMNLIEHV
jgi:hypothetical protein